MWETAGSTAKPLLSWSLQLLSDTRRPGNVPVERGQQASHWTPGASVPGRRTAGTKGVSGSLLSTSGLFQNSKEASVMGMEEVRRERWEMSPEK